MNCFVMLYDSRSINDGAWFEKFSNLAFPDYMFNECMPLKNKIDDNVVLNMDKDDPDGRVLYDMVENIFKILIISEPFKKILETCNCGNVEYLPISIKNQRDKIEKEKYYIVNLIDSIDYIDKDKSTIEYSSLDEKTIFSVENTNLNIKNIPENRDLFRADYYPKRYIVSEKLKNKIEDEELEGMIFVPIEEYDSALF